MSQVFPYATEFRLALFWAPFGVRPGHDGVTLTDGGHFVAKFGFLTLETPLANIVGAHVTEGYRWWTAAGARMSFADDGLTFGPTRTAGSACTSVTRSRVHSGDPATRR